MKMVKIMKIVRLIETAPKSPNLVFTLFLTVENPLFWIWPSFKFFEFNYCHQWPLIEFTIKLLFKFLDIWELQPQIVTQKNVTDEQTQSLKRSFRCFLMFRCCWLNFHMTSLEYQIITLGYFLNWIWISNFNLQGISIIKWLVLKIPTQPANIEKRQTYIGD